MTAAHFACEMGVAICVGFANWGRRGDMKSSALGAVSAQGTQALASFVVQILVARTLGLEGLGIFALLYGVVVLTAAVVSGLIGDSLVVLNRYERGIRSALQFLAVGTSALLAAAVGAFCWATGLISPFESVLLAVLVFAFCLEEVVRRVLMAHLAFWRVAVIDVIGLAVGLAVIGSVSLTGQVDLSSFFGAIACGQVCALLAALPLLPARERYLVGWTTSGIREVLGYGSWRSLQQLLRPAMLTAVRSLVTLVASLAATGMLEAARIYVAPVLLGIGGLSSYLFVSFSRDRATPVRALIRRADRAVAVLLVGTLTLGVVAIAALPSIGALLFGTSPELLAVAGWLCYSASVAAVTPYGALAATGGRQATVLAIRAMDTAVGVVAVGASLVSGIEVAAVPLVIAVSSLLGGIAIRMWILRSMRSADESEPKV